VGEQLHPCNYYGNLSEVNIKRKRISVRVSGELWDRIQESQRERETGYGEIVRQVLQAYFADTAPNGDGPAKGTLRPLHPPEEIMPLLPKYLGWGSGDIRRERERLYRELLAASFACKQFFPRTPAMVEGYSELRRLAALFGIVETCQTS
jgi:hypothetical protein